VDSRTRLACHQAIFERKRMIREVFGEFHALFRRLEDRYLDATGSRSSLAQGGADAGYLFRCTVDGHRAAPRLDVVMDAQRIALAAASVRVVYAQNSFHHFPDPERFLSELERVLAPGGGAIILEPYYGPAATFVYRRLFRTEGFEIP
jgi:SAM-dependent methyltransferase